MEEPKLVFWELVNTARAAGFDVTDGNGLPIREDMASALEDENLTGEHARLEFREATEDEEWGIVADIHVRDQVYLLRGEVRNLEDLKSRLGGIARPEDRPWD